MPSFSKLLLLATLFLSGALSLPVAEPGDISITHATKRQGSWSIVSTEPGISEKREAEAEAEPGNGFHSGGQYGGGITRGSKREAEAEAEAEPGNGFHSGGQFGGGITRGSRREAEAEPEAEPGNGFHSGGQYGGGITRGS